MNITDELGVNETRLLDRIWYFASRVAIPDDPSECWIWTGLVRSGYGTIWIYSIGNVPAHRFSYLVFKGPLEDKFCLHECDNPFCVNPLHLKAGTQLDNVHDMWSRGRKRRRYQQPFYVNRKYKPN